MVYPKTTTELSRKSIANLMKEIEFLKDNLFENLIFNENLSPEAREILEGRAEQLEERIVEIYKRPLSQRLTYLDFLKNEKHKALIDEKFREVRKTISRIGYYRHFIKSDLPPSYI